jgi:uncharacterized protein DUF2604
MKSPTTITLTVVVNGEPLQESAKITAPIRTLMQRALFQWSNSGQLIENWELRDANGKILDPARKIRDSNLTPGATVFLNLKAGLGEKRC